ncbi:hypothetical protein FRX31_033603, partial [Thalictrum thalictroides]
MRHLWHLQSNRNNLWVAWVKNKLIRGRNLWQIKIPQDCTWSWRNILQERKEATYLVTHQIGDGTSTKLWPDPWLPNGIQEESFPQALLYDSRYGKDASVASLIDNGEWTLPEHASIHLNQILHYLPNVSIGG